MTNLSDGYRILKNGILEQLKPRPSGCDSNACRRLRRRMQRIKSQKEIKHLLKERAAKAYEEKEAQFPEAEHLREVERVFLSDV